MQTWKGWNAMSGYKHATVTISEQEYRRLHDADMKRRFKGHTKAKAKNSGQATELTNALQQMENRQQQLEQAFSDLDQNFDRSETAAIQEILLQNALCYESLTGLIEETTLSASDSIAFLSERFTAAMQREREQYRGHLQSLVQRLDSHEQREQVRTEVARQWLRQAVVLADFIQEQFNHERFLPGRLSKILRSLNFAQNNLAQGFLESSLQVSQQAFLELSELHFELEQCIVEWQTEYEKTNHTIRQILTDLELNSSVNALGLQGEELSDQVDLDYWTEGKYRQLLDVCRKVRTRLDQDQEHLSTEELKRVNTELFPFMTERFESILYEARFKALNSQLRMNIAERALQALEVHGFKLNESGYADKDMRARFTADLENSDGSHVSIQVLPNDQSTQELTNELIVITNHPYLKTEQEARLQWEELRQTLNQYNLNVSRPEVRSIPPGSMPDPRKSPTFINQQLLHAKSQEDVR
jgi:hypothetical protein